MKAVWNGKVIAESHETVVIDGNHYFPESSVSRDFLVDSKNTTVCPWKGTASYYSLNVDGEINKDAAWIYPEPKPKAESIRGHIAFWRGVQVGD